RGDRQLHHPVPDRPQRAADDRGRHPSLLLELQPAPAGGGDGGDHLPDRGRGRGGLRLGHLAPQRAGGEPVSGEPLADGRRALARRAPSGVRLAWFWDVPEFRRALGLILVLALSAFLLLPLLTLLLWAFADEWRYPGVIPQGFSLRRPTRAG